MKYTMTMTAYQLAGSGTEVYRQVDVTTLEGCMYFIIFSKNFTVILGFLTSFFKCLMLPQLYQL